MWCDKVLVNFTERKLGIIINKVLRKHYLSYV